MANYYPAMVLIVLTSTPTDATLFLLFRRLDRRVWLIDNRTEACFRWL